MSQYANFAIKVDEKRYLPLGDYGRSSVVYKAFYEYLPYEGKVAITSKILGGVREALDGQEAEYNKIIGNYKNKINICKEMVGQVDPNNAEQIISGIVSQIEEYCEYIKDVEEELEEIKWARNFCHMIFQLMDEVRYTDIGIDPEDYIYGGIEYNFFSEDEDE